MPVCPFVCMPVCRYACMSPCLCAWMPVCLYACTRVWVYGAYGCMGVWVYGCMCTSVSVYLCKCSCVYVCGVNVCVDRFVYIYIKIDTAWRWTCPWALLSVEVTSTPLSAGLLVESPMLGFCDQCDPRQFGSIVRLLEGCQHFCRHIFFWTDERSSTQHIMTLVEMSQYKQPPSTGRERACQVGPLSTGGGLTFL